MAQTLKINPRSFAGLQSSHKPKRSLGTQRSTAWKLALSLSL